MSYRNFYRFISKRGNSFVIRKDGEYYGSYQNIEDALYERDRLVQIDWDVDLWVGLAETNNPYYQITLPPFDREATYISEENECWVVREKGKNQGFCVRRNIDGKSTYFGRYRTREEAEKRVKELEKNGWKK